MNEAITALVVGACLLIGGPAGALLGHYAGRLSRTHDHRRNP